MVIQSAWAAMIEHNCELSHRRYSHHMLENHVVVLLHQVLRV